MDRNMNNHKKVYKSDGSVSTVTKDKVTTVKDGVTTIVEKGKITTIQKDGTVKVIEAPKTNNKPPGQKPPAQKKK